MACLKLLPLNKIYEALLRDLLEFPLVLHPVVQLAEKTRIFTKKYNHSSHLFTKDKNYRKDYS